MTNTRFPYVVLERLGQDRHRVYTRFSTLWAAEDWIVIRRSHGIDSKLAWPRIENDVLANKLAEALRGRT